MAQRLKHLPGMRETWVQSLGWEHPLEKGMATHSSILAWRIKWTVQSVRSQSQQRLSDFHFHYIYIYHCIHGMEYTQPQKKNEKNEILLFATI